MNKKEQEAINKITVAFQAYYDYALRKGLEGQELAVHMFIGGMKYLQTKEVPTDPFEEIFNKINNG